ncbi:uncharacterized protein N7529_004562 [Penicillium soppii]|uniref:uncharacterized protein n=1 Tax=Penicillium soppii TaxID=69789 RepID=UPI0025496CF7|nr:uncharacterized protein N7529_004562 [Penicillium soppii]KAJ5872209.1 hypothetical protein N7529_004562 [Penicillium soppii]
MPGLTQVYRSSCLRSGIMPRSVEVQRELQLTNELELQLRNLTPGSGGYLNEANVMLRIWKEDFYGAD